MILKRGQRASVTPYLVIGIVLLIISGIVFTVIASQQEAAQNREARRVTHLSLATLQIEPYVKSCIKSLTHDAILELAVRTENGNSFIVTEAEQFIPTYLQTHLQNCVDWKYFPQFDIHAGDYTVNLSSSPSNFRITVLWPITLKQEGIDLELKDFELEFPLALSKLFAKIDEIQRSTTSLDLDLIFEQEIDIRLQACQNQKIVYAIDDEEYQLEGSVVSFFFDAPLSNLTALFLWTSGLHYELPVADGFHILRKENGRKKLIFETTRDGFVKGCSSTSLDRDLATRNASANASQYYTFSLIKDNRAIASATSTKAERVTITQINSSFVFEGNLELPLTLTFLVDDDLPDLFKILTNTSDVGTPNGRGARTEEAVLVPSEQRGNYRIAREQMPGTYTLRSTKCKSIGTGNYRITLTGLNYDEDEFTAHARARIEEMQSVAPFNESRTTFQIAFAQNSCKEFNCENEVRASAALCPTSDLLIGLVKNPLLGSDHQTSAGISYSSSYLSDNKNYCISCGLLYELGKQMGLAESTDTMSFMSLKNASLERSRMGLAFSADEQEKIRMMIGEIRE